MAIKFLEGLINRLIIKKLDIKIDKYRRNIELIKLNQQIFSDTDNFGSIDWHLKL